MTAYRVHLPLAVSALLFSILIGAPSAATEGAGHRPTRLPRWLSQTGVFQNLATLQPATGAVPYEVNAPFWSDGAKKTRWMMLPGSGQSADPRIDRIIVKPGLPWQFPTGTIFIKHFGWATDEAKPEQIRKLETRLIVRDKDAGVYGMTYRWNAAQTDAELVEADGSETLSVRKANGTTVQQRWDFPGPDQCLVCHNSSAEGGVLGVSYRQIDRTVTLAGGHQQNQLVAWNNASMLSKSLDEPKALAAWNLLRAPATVSLPFWAITQSPRLVPPTDTSYSLAERARSYIDANCSNCHVPGIVEADWDARITTPLTQQRLIDGKARNPRAGTSVLIKPGDPKQSLIYLRIATVDPQLRMPPLARNAIDERGARLIAEWITSLPQAHSDKGGR